MPGMSPYTFGGSVVINGAVKEGVQVWIHDITQQEGHNDLWIDSNSVVKTNSDGFYVIDLANCATQNGYTYANGDVIRVHANSGRLTQFYQHTVDTTNSSRDLNFSWRFGGGSLYVDGLKGSPVDTLPESGLRVGLNLQLKSGFESGTNLAVIKA